MPFGPLHLEHLEGSLGQAGFSQAAQIKPPNCAHVWIAGRVQPHGSGFGTGRLPDVGGGSGGAVLFAFVGLNRSNLSEYTE